MSLSKSSKENYHLDRKSKAMVIQAIKEIEIKEDGKKRSKREIAAILGRKLGRKISHTTVGKLMKKHELIKKQPEFLDNSDRWRYRKNKQYHLLDERKLEFESDIEETLERAFSLGNLTIDTIVRVANC